MRAGAEPVLWGLYRAVAVSWSPASAHNSSKREKDKHLSWPHCVYHLPFLSLIQARSNAQAQVALRGYYVDIILDIILAN